MEERKERIFEFFKDKDYTPMKAKEIAIILGVPKNEYNDFLNILKELEDEYKIRKNRKNRYIIVEEQYYEGYYRKNQKGFGFVKVNEEEIYISKENSLNALNEDKVLIQIIKEKSKDHNAEGKIVKILKHEKDTVVGIFQKNHNF